MKSENGKCAGGRSAGPMAGLRAFLSLSWLRTGTGPGARSAVNTPRGPVQQELRLADIKPVCNDLSGADWEVVQPQKSAAKLAFLRNLALTGGSKAGGNRVAASAAGAGKI